MHSSSSTTDLLTLVGQDTRLRKVANTCGGEWKGACSKCGGKDRMIVQPHAKSGPRWTCRNCIGVDKWNDLPGYLMWRDGLRYSDALAALGMETRQERPQPPAEPQAPDDSLAPSERWQWAAGRVVDMAERALWHPRLGSVARAYLYERGFTDDTIKAAHLGFRLGLERVRPALWGMDEQAQPKGVYVGNGIVIPFFVDGQIWKLQTRNIGGMGGYVTVSGSANVLYGHDTLRIGRPAVLVEGPFDALTVWQEADDVVGVAACGTSGARRMRSIAALAQCRMVLVALDNEPENKDVQRACAYWLDVLQPRAVRWQPYTKDCNEMHTSGMDVRAWTLAGLEVQR